MARGRLMRRGHAIVLGCGLAGSALALGVSPTAAAQTEPVAGAYGGGFIEFLMQRHQGAGALYNEPQQAAPAYGVASLQPARADLEPVSYTHLTLPTIYSV